MSAAPDSKRFVLIPVASEDQPPPDGQTRVGHASAQARALQPSADEGLDRHSDISALLRPPAGSAPNLDAIAAKVKALATGNSTSEVLQLGELIFREVYGSQRMLLHKGGRQASLRRLAAHPDVPCKVTTLWRAVSVYEMSLRLPQLLSLEELGVSRLRAVIGLPVEIQEQLLRAAVRERWTKRQLEREAARHRAEKRRGRRPLPKLVRWTRELERLLDRSAELGATDMVLRSGPAAEVRAALARCSRRCEELNAELEVPPSTRRAADIG